MSKKPRPTGLEAALRQKGRDVFATVAEEMASGRGCVDMAEWIHKEFGIRTSKSAVARLWQNVIAPALAEADRRIFEVVQVTVGEGGEGGEDYGEAALALARKRALKLELDPKASQKEKNAALAKLLTARGQDILRDKLEAEQKQKIALAMDALFEEIQGNPEAEKAFRNLQKALPTPDE